MKAVVIGESSGASRDAIMAVYPRHKAVVDKFVAQGAVLGIGPFTDGGNMAIFKTREAAEAFTREDPFILEGVVKSFVIKDWRDALNAGAHLLLEAGATLERTLEAVACKAGVRRPRTCAHSCHCDADWP